MFIGIFGILIALYCCTSGKKPPSESSHDQFEYSYASDDQSLTCKDLEVEEENETEFNNNSEYRPPEITVIVKNDDSTSDN